MKLYVVKGQVYFRHPKSDQIEGVWDGQLAMVPILDVMSVVEARVQALKKRDDTQVGHVERNWSKIMTFARQRVSYRPGGQSPLQVVRTAQPGWFRVGQP